MRIWIAIVVAVVVYAIFFVIDFQPSREGGWLRYAALALLGGLTLRLVEIVADRIGGPDKTSDPLGRRVLRLAAWSANRSPVVDFVGRRALENRRLDDQRRAVDTLLKGELVHPGQEGGSPDKP